MKIKHVFITLFILACGTNLFSQSEELMKKAEKGREAYRNKQYVLSAQIYEEIIAEGSFKEAELYYNAACSWALAGNKPNAYRNLDSCVKYNWRDFGLTTTDPDLESLRKDAEWTVFINKFRQKLEHQKSEMRKQTPTYFWGMYLGILLVFCLYNLMMFFSVRDTAYLYYSLSIFFLM